MDIFLPSKRRWAGFRAEAQVLLHFEKQGYHVVVQNGRVGRAEVDLLLWNPNIRRLLAIEVKYRSKGWSQLPLSPRQARRIFRAARKLRPIPLLAFEPEFVLCVLSGKLESPQIQVFENLWESWD
ncbi:MAG: YraN family protein [Schleiferiaceae bacterium]|nr:YraN family protein [Schleiferiaceae bacterium]